MLNMDIGGFVLTGGASSRMGRDKAGLWFRGTTLGERAAGVLGEVAGRVSVVGGSVGDFPVVADIGSGGRRAAIYGVHSALVNCRAEWAAIFACDLPFVTPELFRRLLGVAEAEGGCEAVVPRQADGRPQPLAALYRREACLREVELCMNDGELRLGGFLDRLDVRYLEPEAYADLDLLGSMFLNVNTPDDYEIALSRISS